MNVMSLNIINKPCLVNVTIEGVKLQMEVDCGASVSVMCKKQYFSRFPNVLKKSSDKLVVVNVTELQLLGEIDVIMEYKDEIVKLNLLVIDCIKDFYPLFGRSWLDVFVPNWRMI